MSQDTFSYPVHAISYPVYPIDPFRNTHAMYAFLKHSYQSPAISKKIATVVLSAFALLASFVSDLAYLPFRHYVFRILMNAYQKEIESLPQETLPELRTRIETYMDQHCKEGTSTAIPQGQREVWIQTIMASYTRSSTILAPLMRTWVEHLLNEANSNHKKLVFMARDGIGPYLLAKKLMQQPTYQAKYSYLATNQNHIVLGFFSKRVIYEAAKNQQQKELLQQYVSELHLQKNDPCIFVDIGWAGNIIDPLKQVIGIENIKFNYFIAVTPKAEGFAGNHTHFLRSMPPINGDPDRCAGGNPAAHWLEDLHQGVRTSPKMLSLFLGKVRPSILVQGNPYPVAQTPNHKFYTCPPYSLEFLLRIFSRRAIVDSANTPPLKGNIFNEYSPLGQARKALDDSLQLIKEKQIPPFITHLPTAQQQDPTTLDWYVGPQITEI